VVGRAIASSKQEHQLLPKLLALPVFSSDPLSSVAYATEEMMLVLALAGAAALSLMMPIAIAISIQKSEFRARTRGHRQECRSLHGEGSPRRSNPTSPSSMYEAWHGKQNDHSN
jgi:hypothetical protein